MRELTPRSFPALALIFIVVAYALILLVVPFVTMLQGALGDGLAPVLKTFGDPAVQHALLVTFILSTIAVSINGVFGLVTAWVLVRHRFVGRRFFDSLVDIPFVFATPIAGYAVIIMFGRGGGLRQPLSRLCSRIQPFCSSKFLFPYPLLPARFSLYSAH